MKKIFIIFVGLFLLNCFNCEARYNSSAYLMDKKDTIPLNIKIVKKDKKYGVINKDNKELIVPYEYNSMEKLGVDTLKVCERFERCKVITNNNLPVLRDYHHRETIIAKIDENKPADISNSIYIGLRDNGIHITIPSAKSKDSIKKILEQHNKLSFIKFNNYPENNFFVLAAKDKKGNEKYGFLIPDGDDWELTYPKFDEVNLPDEQSYLYKILKMSNSSYDDIIVKLPETEGGNYIKYNPLRAIQHFPDWNEIIKPVHIPFNKEKTELKNGELYITYCDKNCDKKYDIDVVGNIVNIKENNNLILSKELYNMELINKEKKNYKSAIKAIEKQMKKENAITFYEIIASPFEFVEAIVCVFLILTPPLWPYLF